MRKISLALAAAATALAVGGTAFAQQPGAAKDRPAAGQELTRAAVQERTTQAFQRLDANGDGVLNEGDREARQKARFDRVDANSDGSISFDEYTAQRTRRHDALADRGERRPGGDRMGRRGMMRAGGFDGMRGMGRMADADKDGSISQAEFQAAALARFDQADSNGDGTISADERKAQRDAQRERFREMRESRNQS